MILKHAWYWLGEDRVTKSQSVQRGEDCRITKEKSAVDSTAAVHRDWSDHTKHLEFCEKHRLCYGEQCLCQPNRILYCIESSGQISLQQTVTQNTLVLCIWPMLEGCDVILERVIFGILIASIARIQSISLWNETFHSYSNRKDTLSWSYLNFWIIIISQRWTESQFRTLCVL